MQDIAPSKTKMGITTYADLLIDVIKENDLQLIDGKVQSQK